MPSESSRYVSPEEMVREATKLSEVLGRACQNLLEEQHKEIYQRISKFHAHLDICEQCERHPSDLCPEGARLLKYAATGK